VSQPHSEDDEVQVCTDWILTPHRAAIHAPTSTAVVADLHLGYGVVRQDGGDAVPTRGIEDTIADLVRLFADFRPARLVIAGDLLEKSRVPGYASDFLIWLASKGVELAGLVPGNHDRGSLRKLLGDRYYPDGFSIGDWRVVHGHGRLPAGQLIYGHHHPSLGFGREVKAPCYVVGGRSIILPAHSRNASGVNVLACRAWQRCRCYAIASNRVLDFGIVSDLGRRLDSSPLRDGHLPMLTRRGAG
jgi:uncharacterized protein